MRAKKALAGLVCTLGLVFLLTSVAYAQCAAVPNTLANGNPTDATQVMGNFNALTSCLNTGQLTVPPVSSLAVTGAGGGTVTVNNPLATSPYTLSLPATTGTSGQFLQTNGSGQSSWATVPTAVLPSLVDGIPVGKPPGSALSWMNQGTASYVEHLSGPLTMTVPSQSGDQIRGLGQTPPGTTPYTLTAKIDMLLWGSNFSFGGLYVEDSSGKLITLVQVASTGNPAAIQVSHWNSASSYSSGAANIYLNGLRTLWYRVTNDGTNWIFYVSPNGADWVQIYSESLTTFLGSSIVSLGVFGDSNNGSLPNQFVSIWSFELASGTGTNSAWQ